MMKQCAGCGKRYDEAQTTCPSCWTRTWVFAPAGNTPAELPANPYPCPECGYYASAGTPSCPQCKKKLRPRALEWLCMLGLLGSPAAFFFGIFTNIVQARNFWMLPDLLVWIATGLACWELLKGKYRGYRAMQGVLIGGPVLLVLLIIIAEITQQKQAAADLAAILVLRLISGALLFLFLLNRTIQDYCALDKPKEKYEAKEVFLEQANLGKAQRLGSSITRNL